MGDMTYALEQLGPHEFERLVQALLLKLYGPTVTVYGAGPDSGRDATFEGRAIPVTVESHDAAPWDGYHVFQVKFREQLQSTAANRQWLLTQIKRELDRWTDPYKRRKGRAPEYIVFVTNVALGGAVDGGWRGEGTTTRPDDDAVRPAHLRETCALAARGPGEAGPVLLSSARAGVPR